MIFRLKYALGLIPSADQLDAKWEKLIKTREDLIRMEESEELKQYLELKELIESSDFQLQKKEIEGMQYHGSDEEQSILAYEALAKSHSIRSYQKISDSPRLQRFESIVEGPELKRFLHLEKEVGSDDFKERMAAHQRKELVKTPEYAIFKEYNDLKKSGDIRFWQKFIHSEGYQNYLNVVGSEELSKMEELKSIISSEAFKLRVEYLKDKKRFLKSDEYKNIQAFEVMDKSSFMVEYRKLKKAKELDFFEKWDLLLNEDFSDNELNNKQWQPENWLNFKLAGVSFSQEGEMQSFHGQNNLVIHNHTLSLVAKKEKVNGMAWNPVVGLTPKSFDYSSSMINNANFFRIKEGVVEAKLRFKKDATITSAFSLTGDMPFPQIDLVRSTQNGVGLGIVEKQGEGSSKYIHLNGLNDENYHIYRLELWNNELVWKINDYEIFRCFVNRNDSFFFNLLTTLHGEVNDNLLPHHFEVGWIRCYSLKS